MVITLDAQLAVTPAGRPVAVPIPVAPAVVCVMFVMAVFTQAVGDEEAAPAKQSVSARYRPNVPPAVSTGEKLTVFSSTVYLSFVIPPARVVRPVLPAGNPLYSLTIPLGASTSPLPDTMMLPPVGVPAELLLPALSTIAPAYPAAVLVLDDVVTGSVSWISPASVSIRISPVAVIPSGLTLPMVSPPLASTKLRLPSRLVASPPARVVILFDAFVSVKVPVPCRPSPLAVRAAVWVTAPVACRLILLAVAVRAALIPMLPPYTVTGPLIVAALPKVTLAVLVVLPIKSPVLFTFRFVTG